MFRHRSMLVAWIILVGLIGSVALAAQRGVVKFKDGRPSMEGDVEEKADSVVVSIPAGERKIQIEITRDAIAAIEYVGDLEAEYNARASRLDAKDPKARIELARWAFDRRKLDWARSQLEGALTIDPNNAEATTLLETVRLQIRLELRPPAVNTPTAPTTVPVRHAGNVEQRFLTKDQINMIRQKEIVQLKEKNLQIDVSMDLQRRFTTAMNIEPSIFKAYSSLEQFLMIDNQKDRKFTDDVKIRNDPASLLKFRREVLPTIIASCAGAHCHGGAQGGGLILYPSTSDEGAYTNFYILQKYSRKIEPVTPIIGKGPVEWKMIDRAQPAQSLLLQYCLPTDIAEADHPQVLGWKPIFSGLKDARYQNGLGWIRDSLVAIEPDYGIAYEVPKATTRPSGK